ncbi:hypothetical protein, partial [uncultured Nostoc sp.]|uniref:hypothetical protein n=1 Tax=uncultured Nostoc sp. TaxID=340711 RepID=UPI0035CBDBE8
MFNKWLRKIIYVIANEVKQSQTLRLLRFASLTRRYRKPYTRNDNLYLILHYYLKASLLNSYIEFGQSLIEFGQSLIEFGQSFIEFGQPFIEFGV